MKKLLFVVLLLFTFFNPAFCTENEAAIEAYNQGISYYNNGNVQKSIESFRRAINISPTFQEAYYNLAQVLAAQGQTNEAILHYKKAILIDDMDYQSMFALAEILYQKGNLDEALSYAKKILYENEFYFDALKLKDIIEKQIKLTQKPVQSQAQAITKIQAQPSAKPATQTTQTKPVTSPVASIIPKTFAYSDIKSPSGVAVDNDGNVYIASFSENIVYKYNQKNERSIFVNSTVLKGPVGLCFDDTNVLYIANYNGGNILKVLPNGAPYVFAKVEKPYLLYASEDFLYVTEQATNTIKRFQLNKRDY